MADAVPPQVLFVPGRKMPMKQAQIKARNLDKSLGSIACCRVLPKAKKGPPRGTDSGTAYTHSYRVVVSGMEDREKTAREIKTSIGVDIGASVSVVGVAWLLRPMMPPPESDGGPLGATRTT